MDVVWQASVLGNEEILLKKTVDKGVTFTKVIEMSNNKVTSECPSKSGKKCILHGKAIVRVIMKFSIDKYTNSSAKIVNDVKSIKWNW